MKWISVKERLPNLEDGKFGSYYAIVNRPYGVSYAWYTEDTLRGKKVKRWKSFSGALTDVTHWMPLPEPPKQ